MVSVIIPVFNSAETITTTLQSLESQSYTDFEVVIIDDGSTDDSLKKVKKFAAKSRMSFLIEVQKNSGASAARNRGIELSRGEYILFLDSDDCYEPKFIEKLVAAVEEHSVDISICRFWISDGDKIQQVKNGAFAKTSGEIDRSFFLKLYANHKYYQVSWWCCCYRKDIITENNIWFDCSLKYGEDFKFFATYLYQCKKGFFLDEYLYRYNMNRNSVTHNLSYKIVDNIEAQKYVVELWAQDISMKSSLLEFILQRATVSVAVKMATVSHDAFVKLIHQYPVNAAMKYIFFHGETLKVKLSAMLYIVNPSLFELTVRIMKRI